LLKFLTDKKIVSLATGGSHSMAVGLDGQVYAWGKNDRAELALGHTNNVNVPTLIKGFNDEEVISLKLTNVTGLALTDKGKVYAFGPNNCGILGLGHNNLIFCPTVISDLEGKNIVSIRHSQHSLALTDDGKVYSWGFGSYGTLGLGDKRDIGTPTLVSQLEKEKIILIKLTCHCSYAISENGQVFAWCNNRSGQLGLGYKGNEEVLLLTPMVGLESKKVINLKPHSWCCLIFTDEHEIFITGSFPTGIKGQMDVESSERPLFLGNCFGRNFCDGLERTKD
jgi:alpha-tubulin suppressor-like RCC1 family protein